MSMIKFQVVRSQITFGDLRLPNTHLLSLQVLGVLCKTLLHLVCVICIIFLGLDSYSITCESYLLNHQKLQT
jgi:uncharacterized membrane protein